MQKLNHAKGYRKFVNGRDEALEIILRNFRLRVSDHTRKAFKKILEIVQIKYPMLINSPLRHEMDRIELQIQQAFDQLGHEITQELTQMRRKTFMLAYAGEAQAIAQTLAKSPSMDLSRNKIEMSALTKKLANGLSPFESFNLKFSKIRRQIISALEYSLAFGEPVDKALGRVYLQFPKQKELAKKAVLKTVKVEEANRPKFSTYGPKDESSAVEITPDRKSPVHGFEWDQETWGQVIDDLGSEYVLTDRSPETFFDITNPYNDLPIKDVEEGDKIYAWEIENEVTHDFVEQVRSGQIEAANKNGINEFVWIAILDDRTDDCCEWRSGLLTSEIEARLKTDKADDSCDAIVPPAHFNCRCTLAPASSDLEAVDNSDTEREFSEWLNER